MTRVIKSIICTLAILLVLAPIGCEFEGTEETSSIVTADNGLSQIEIPDNWSERTDLNDEADIQVAYLRKEMYIIVMSEDKQDFEDSFTAESYSELTREFITDGLTSLEISDTAEELEIDGHSALQYEIRGTMDGIKIAYLHITVDGDQAFHQIIAWTLPSKWDTNRPILESVINSFQELSG